MIERTMDRTNPETRAAMIRELEKLGYTVETRERTDYKGHTRMIVTTRSEHGLAAWMEHPEYFDIERLHYATMQIREISIRQTGMEFPRAEDFIFPEF